MELPAPVQLVPLIPIASPQRVRALNADAACVGEFQP